MWETRIGTMEATVTRNNHVRTKQPAIRKITKAACCLSIVSPVFCLSHPSWNKLLSINPYFGLIAYKRIPATNEFRTSKKLKLFVFDFFFVSEVTIGVRLIVKGYHYNFKGCRNVTRIVVMRKTKKITENLVRHIFQLRFWVVNLLFGSVIQF